MKYCKLFIIFALLAWSNMSQGQDKKEFICGVGMFENTLTTGEELSTGKKLYSKNHKYELVMQRDGNLCIYTFNKNGKSGVWCNMVHGFEGATLKMQADGNLVVYDCNNKPKWSSKTHPYFNKKFKDTRNKPVKLLLGNDGILRLYTADNKVVWTNKKGVIVSNSKRYVLKTGEKLSTGERLYSKNNQYNLVMQSDGNLCIYKVKPKSGVWCNMVHGFKGATLKMQADGNLVVYNADNKSKWSSKTHPYFKTKFKGTRNKPVKLLLGNDGILRLYNAANKVVWLNKKKIKEPIGTANGFSVNYVAFSQGNFQQKSPSKWTEQNANNKIRYTFEEMNRDEWSVYLYDASRKVHIQLDLHTRKIMYSDPNTPKRTQYKITKVRDKVSGYLATAITVAHLNSHKPLAEFIQVGRKTWREHGDGNKVFNFQEMNRDEWSVYLYDASRKVHIQLDLHTRKIMYSGPNSPRRDLYKIIRVTSNVTGPLANHVIFSSQKNGKKLGAFKKTKGKNWVEEGANGQRNFYFVEVNRDDWSVYLFDRSRNVHIQLDMHTEKVMYNKTGKAAISLYHITKVKW